MGRTALGSLLGLALCTTACGHKVEVSFIEAARVDIDTELETVMVINRSMPGGAGEAVVGAAEGLATGEGFDADADTSRIAVDALLDVLAQTERFEVVEVRMDGHAADPSIWDEALDPRQIARLCRKASCDAIVALDGFDTDTLHAMTVDKERGEPHAYTARTDADAVATWRTYDADARTVVDEARLTTTAEAVDTGDSRDEVSDTFVVGDTLQYDLAAELGRAYGERIAPHVVVLERGYYRTGSPEMRLARKALKAGDWDRAVALWRRARAAGDEKLAAKARHNLALAAEVEGDLDRAVELATLAGRTLSRPKTRDYAASLRSRVRDAERLERQLPQESALASL